MDFRLTSEPQDVSVFPGSEIALNCDASESTASVSWRWAPALPLDEAPFIDFDSDSYRKQLTNGSLKLTNIGEGGAQVGDYQCIASLDGRGTVVSRIATISIPSKYYIVFLLLLVHWKFRKK